MSKSKILVAVILILLVGSVNCIGAAVKIHRDDWGVPHIYASNIEGLYYGWGYASAQDRLFQLEMLKRIYNGQVSELFGEDYYSLDLYWLTEYPSIAELEEEFAALDPKYQKIMVSYAEGVNAWIDEVMEDTETKLPLEFHELGITPQYWTAMDTAAALMANLGLFMDLTNETVHLELYTYLQDKYDQETAMEYFDDIAWINDSSAYTSIKAEDQTSAYQQTDSLSQTNQLSQLNWQGLAQFANNYPTKQEMIVTALQAMGEDISQKVLGNAIEAMSYCAVVGSEKSETGKSLLMSGPQVDYWTPGMVYEVGLHGAGFDVVGTTLIGSPYLMFGETRTTGFSCTAGADNIVDIYEETLNPENPSQYLYQGQWLEMEERQEEIWVKGEVESRQVTLYQTIHGPVLYFADTDGDGKDDVAYTKKTACYDSYLSSVVSYTELMLADTPEEFEESAKLLDPTLNYFYTDNEGNIGYYHCGKIPIRPKNIDPRFPLPGTGEYEWLGYIDRDELPHIMNPASDYVVNWNNKPAQGFSNGDLTSIFTWGCWSEDHRSFNLDRLIREKAPIDVQDLKDITHEIADAHLEARAVKRFLLEALEGTNDPRLAQAKQYLAQWNNLRGDENHDGYYDSIGITIFEEWWYLVNKNAFADELGPFWLNDTNFGGLLYNYGGYSFFVRTILGEDATVPVKRDWYNGQGWQEVFIASMEEALDQLETKYGTDDMTKWVKEIKMMPFPSTHLTGAPTSFGSVPNVKYMDRGSQNHIVEGTWPVVTGINVVPPGQSGFISKDGQKHKHFEDQLVLYANWEYKDMLMKKGDVLINSESTEILIYNPKKH